jgi:TPR repeat protein
VCIIDPILQVCLSVIRAVDKKSQPGKWLRKAAEQNDAKAQSNLGLCYVIGRGVPEDRIEAYLWFQLATAQGVESARNNPAKLEAMLSPEQLTEGKRRGDRWLERRKKLHSEGEPKGFSVRDK